MVTYSLENWSIINLYVYTGLDNDVSIIPIMVGYCPLKFMCSIGEMSHILWVFFSTIEMVLSDLRISTEVILHQMSEAN